MIPPVHRWETATQPRAAVHIVHGMAEHGARYDRFARALNTAGYAVWAHDHRGHGINPEPGLRGHFADRNGWRLVLEDVRAVARDMAREFPGVPLVLFAHSMGSFMAQALMGEPAFPYDRVILSGTGGAPDAKGIAVRLIAAVQLLALKSRTPGRWLTSLVFGHYNRQFAPNRSRFDWLSRDDTEVDKYCRDPNCGFAITAQAWIDLLDGKSGLGSAAHARQIPKHLPILIIAGERDPVGDNGKNVRRLLCAYETAGLGDVTSCFYAGARHELVNETNREQVTRDVIAWLNRA
jgi:alpha-beta hydrolase superfamily lysophospholipase